MPAYAFNSAWELPLNLGQFLQTGRHGFPVLNDDGSLFGVVSLEDYRQATTVGRIPPDRLVVRDIATRDVISVYPDEMVGTALRRMAPRDLSRMPVVARDDPRHLVGVVRRNDIVRAYEVGAMRREEARRRAGATRAISDTRAIFVDVPLAPDSEAIGKTIAELDLPRAAVLVSIRRGHELIIPRGDTCLQAGDIVTTLCEREYTEQVKAVLNQLARSGSGQQEA